MPIIQKLVAADRSVNGKDKAEHYDWAAIVGEQPTVAMIDKNELYKDSGYQRDHGEALLTRHQVAIAKNWNWRDCGAIVCARRGVRLMVIDGQNRVMAAMRRSEVTALPCVIVSTTGSDTNRRAEEAAAFLSLNGNRRNVTANQRYTAGLIARDATAMAIERVVSDAGLTVAIGGNKAGSVAFVNELGKSICRIGAETTVFVLKVCASMPSEKAISVRLFRAVCHIRATKPSGRALDDMFWALLAKTPADVADVAMNKYTASCGLTSPRVWANALIVEVNKNVRNKYALYEA